MLPDTFGSGDTNQGGYAVGNEDTTNFGQLVW